MEDTADDRWKLVERVIEITNAAGPEYATLSEGADLIREAGIVPKQHEGKPAIWFTSETMAEWLLGAYLDIVDQDASFAIVPWIQVATERLARAEAPPV